MKIYKYYQPNEKDIKDKRGDCVIRALTKVTNKTWLEVYDELVPIGRELQSFGNDKLVYSEFLKQQGFSYKGISNRKGTKRPTISQFAKEHKEGKYFLVVANHVVGLSDGVYYDTWDSGNCKMYGYWKKEE